MSTARAAHDDPDIEAVGVPKVWTLSMLPPLPVPNHAQQFSEARRGVFTVLYIIGICVGLTHGVGLTVGRITGVMWWVCLVGVYAMAALALVCLVGILFGDPGVVPRTEATCFPIPEEVQCRLSDGSQALDSMSNIVDGSRSYCVRCLVWRSGPDPNGGSSLLATTCARAKPHHCRICNRCVMHFDHHCGVFGRCIAGRGTHGNMKYFVTIIGIGYTAVFLSVLIAVAGVIIRATRDGGWDHEDE
mmetsp:Transcript_5531/g.10880  ORF Transcript_5531/g.10880 Transcript_5531/m.10880 type:complete len:245 (-) Transcript_5531:66-800(-)